MQIHLRERFEKDIRSCEDLIHKICRVYCSSKADREDLFQEILIQLWKAYPTFKGLSKLSTWVYRIALNTSINQQRKRKGALIISEEMIKEDIIAQPDPLEEHYKTMYTAISHLNETEKAIVMLFLEEKSYEDMESILGISQGALRVKMYRIKDKLRNLTNK